jgi:hypothetical protein
MTSRTKLAAVVSVAALMCVGALWSYRTRREPSAAGREVSLYRARHRGEVVADVDVTVEWSNGSRPGGKASFVFRKVQPGEKEPSVSVLGIGDVMWDSSDGYGGYTATLDTTHERWVFRVEAYWTIAGASDRIEKRFPIVPFETEAFQDGDFRAEIVYDTGVPKKTPNQVPEPTSGLAPGRGSS